MRSQKRQWESQSEETLHQVIPEEEYDPFQTQTTGLDKTATGHRLRRFWFRSLVGIFSPLLVLSYYLVIWRVYVAPLDPAPGFIVGPEGAKYVYYGWFVAGIIGLNLSLYSLAGVEAAMLMHPAWDVGDAMTLMMHADASWSGPGGWIKTVKRLVRTRMSPGGSTWPSKLWFVLALPSMAIFVAWPLSGLSFEMASGYVRRSVSGTFPNVTGFSYANFNERHIDDAISGADVTWRNALDARVPGKGAIYTAPGGASFSRAYLPKDDGVPRIFLTAQAENPIDGNSWGLALQYNCSIVKHLSEFTSIKYQKSSNSTNATLFEPRMQAVDPATAIQFVNSSYTDNFYFVAEYAYKVWPNASASRRIMETDPLYWMKQTQCYFNQVENITGDYPGLDDEEVFEMVLWQYFYEAGYVDPKPVFNSTIDYNITELYGAHAFQQWDGHNLTQPMTATGVRCTSSSNVGTADIDGAHSTYRNFVRTDTKVNFQTARCAERFGPGIISSFLQKGGSLMSAAADSSLMSALFSSAGREKPLYASFSQDPIDAGTGTNIQLSYLQANDLRNSLLRAYAAYAVQLMFNGGQRYTATDGTHTTFPNPNVTELLPGSILTNGIVPPEVPAILFLVWSLAVLSFCALYGFRRRWSATLDGYSLFRFGADITEAGKSRIARFSNTREVEECKALHGLPGFVGDKRPQAWIGQIALVDGVPAAKAKLYD
ncbi:hypothetical protein GE09DRAFT_639329 [Coniochaeta sp. 2T2.1]|nr:hypothetical protein GE09DRAFT_639329 [Coniochaeta sp. 2T2.1]